MADNNAQGCWWEMLSPTQVLNREVQKKTNYYVNSNYVEIIQYLNNY
jgi:hypothetical protein